MEWQTRMKSCKAHQCMDYSSLGTVNPSKLPCSSYEGLFVPQDESFVPDLQGNGEAKCSSSSLSWRQDGFVYGGSGTAQASETADRGCNTQIRIIDEVLQPCCKPMADLLGSAAGLTASAPNGSIQAKAYSYLLSKVKVRRHINSNTQMRYQADACYKHLQNGL